MSDLSATGCGSSFGRSNDNNCCSIIIILLLLSCFCGGDNDFLGNIFGGDDCSCIIIILVLFCFCGNGFGGGCGRC